MGGDDRSFHRDQKLVEGLGDGILPLGFLFLVSYKKKAVKVANYPGNLQLCGPNRQKCYCINHFSWCYGKILDRIKLRKARFILAHRHGVP